MSKQLLLGALLIATGCASPEVEDVEESEPLYFETIGRGQYGTPRDTLENVVRSNADWEAMSSAMRPLAAFESVDFSQEMVALIALPAESGGYTIEVESVELLNGEILISYLVSEPGTDCITPTALALPFQAVSIRKSDGTVRFERRSELYKCGL